MQELENVLEEIRKIGKIQFSSYTKPLIAVEDVEKIIRKHMNDGWISVRKQLPKCEEEVLIQTERGTRTTAIYEDGTIREEDSIWHWCDIDGDWDEERDCMIIPEGWWEYRHFNPDDIYNNVIDEEVIAWRPLPEPYRPEVTKP